MSNYLRPRIPASLVFFTVALADRSSDMLIDEIDKLRHAVSVTKAARPFEIEAWVVLPNHMHAIWRLPKGDSDYSVRWGAIKARFTMSMRKAGLTPPPCLPIVKSGRYAGVNPGLRAHKGEVAIWQRRFWEHHIRDQADFDAHLRYCHMSPVRLGLVKKPEDWWCSSIHRDVREGRFVGA